MERDSKRDAIRSPTDEHAPHLLRGTVPSSLVSPTPAAQPARLVPHFMLVPSLACPAECSYCFGPHAGPTMSRDTMDAALDFMARIVDETGQREAKATFHGGEPLMAGHAVWRQALDGLVTRFDRQHLKIALQSNLWLLDDQFCELFRQHNVEIGSSLDGPEDITDQQRGRGYFARTMAGIRRAQSCGMTVGCIATFTPQILPRWREVFDFFLGERIGFSIHAAVPPLNNGIFPSGNSTRGDGALRRQDSFYLTAAEYGALLRQMLDYYVDHRRELTVSSLDQICQGFGCGDGKVCTFRDCGGMFLAIDPDGGIYPCQRFAGRRQYRLGTLSERATLTELMTSPVAVSVAARQEEVRKTCYDCTHLAYCKGGCLYNAWASGREDRVKDPYCQAYRALFDHVRQRVLTEMASEENINAIADRPSVGKGHLLLRKGPLIDLVRDGPHPSHVARTARRIVAAVELAKGPDIPTVATRLVNIGICRTQQSAEASLKSLEKQLHPEKIALNNLYVHVTFGCQLECTHCYARAGSTGAGACDMPVTALAKLLRQAKDAGFRQVVITGGEPLTHPQRDEMLHMLSAARGWTRPMNLVLRTNLAMPLTADGLRLVGASCDQIVASVDGNEQTHDDRRGKGTYATVVRNIEAYLAATRGPQRAAFSPAELSIACVMRAADIRGEAGDSVRALAARLGIRRTRFRPLLPLGRAKDWDEPPTSEALGAHADPMELIENGFHPVASCGQGQNLYVEPSGESFPCYAYHQPHTLLGNVLDCGLSSVLAGEPFRDLATHTVDTNPKCRVCDVRYLCGGACRAWGGEMCQDNLDAFPPECQGLSERAFALYRAALRYLETPDGAGQDRSMAPAAAMPRTSVVDGQRPKESAMHEDGAMPRCSDL